MHICFITPEYPNRTKPEGGLGNYLHKTSLELVARGHSITIFILSTIKKQEFDHGIRLKYIAPFQFHWRLHRVPIFRPWVFLIEHGINTQRVKKVVFRENEKDPIEILQVPNYKALGLSLCHNNHFPIVCRCSSYQPLWRAANNQKRDLTEIIFERLEESQLRNADAVISPSELIAGYVSIFLGMKPAVIRTPFDQEPINHDPSLYKRLLEGKKYLLFFGILNGVKGVDILIDAAGDLLAQHNDLSIVFIGRNDKVRPRLNSVDYLNNRLSEHVESGRVLYSPPIQKADLYPIIQNAFGVILPSRVDNYPNTCLEALSLNVPVVSTYNSSIDEIIEDGKTGFLAKNDDSISLYETINRLLEQPVRKRLQMIRNIQAKVVKMKKEDRVGILIQFFEDVRRGYLKKN